MGKEDRLKKVFICSPCRPRGETPKARERDWIGNINRARQACRYAIDEGKIPYAPHLYFTTILSEADEDERELGILLGLVWLSQCDELWIIGRRITEGMKREIAQAEAWNIKVVHYIPERTALRPRRGISKWFTIFRRELQKSDCWMPFSIRKSNIKK